MVVETFAIEDVWKIGLRNTLNRRLDHFGRITEAKHLTEDNAPGLKIMIGERVVVMKVIDIFFLLTQ